MAAKRLVEKTKARGVFKAHARGCPGDRACRCAARYMGTVYGARDGKLLSKRFPTQREAEIWRGEMRGSVSRGEVRARGRQTVSQAGEALLAGMRDDTLVNPIRAHVQYKPATVRRHERALRLHFTCCRRSGGCSSPTWTGGACGLSGCG